MLQYFSWFNDEICLSCPSLKLKHLALRNDRAEAVLVQLRKYCIIILCNLARCHSQIMWCEWLSVVTTSNFNSMYKIGCYVIVNVVADIFTCIDSKISSIVDVYIKWIISKSFILICPVVHSFFLHFLSTQFDINI